MYLLLSDQELGIDSEKSEENIGNQAEPETKTVPHELKELASELMSGFRQKAEHLSGSLFKQSKEIPCQTL